MTERQKDPKPEGQRRPGETPATKGLRKLVEKKPWLLDQGIKIVKRILHNRGLRGWHLEQGVEDRMFRAIRPEDEKDPQ